MVQLLLIFLSLLCVVGLALYGLGCLLFSAKATNGESSDVLACHRTLERLYIANQLSTSEFTSIREKLTVEFPYVSPPLLSSLTLARIHREADKTTTDAVFTAASSVTPRTNHLTDADDEAVIVAEIAQPEEVHSPPTPSLASRRIRSEEAVRSFDDMPAEVSPRRSWSDLLAGFMQENNIRWGELASGILIVGSAVGLVVSLREELRDTIPYFPALLFMLITAAVNAAGIYTLKRWKLRNTSRGVLVIGLLLVPLNFLSACLLSGERRESSDPVYWLAVAVGIAGFATITWLASRYLLRRRNLPLFVAILGSCVGLLLTNRFQSTSGASWQSWTLGAIPLMAFTIGTVSFAPRLWSRRHWTTRSINRMWLCLGIGAFAFMTALSLVAIRSDVPLTTLRVLAPVWGAACVLIAWCATLVSQESISSDDETPRVAATAVALLSISLVGYANAVAATIPSVFFATSIATGLGLLFVCVHRRFYAGLPVGWFLLALGLLSGLYLSSGRFDWDTPESARSLVQLLVNARSGLWLLFCGLIVVGMQTFLKARFPDNSRVADYGFWNHLAGGSLAAVGCIVTTVASFLRPEDVFDNYTATCLLGVSSVALLVHAVRRNRREWTWIAIVCLVASLAHGLLWNSFLASHVEQLLGTSCRPALLFTLAGLILAATALAFRRQNLRKHLELSEGMQPIVFATYLAVCLALIATSRLVGEGTGIASLLGIGSFISSLMMAWAARTIVGSSAVVGVSGVVLSVMTSELCVRQEWIKNVFSLRHAFIQLSVLAAWAAEWQVIAAYLTTPHWRSWLTKDEGRFVEKACEFLVFAMLGVCCLGVLPEIATELSRPFSLDSWQLAFARDYYLAFVALSCVAFATVTGLVLRPQYSLVQGLVALYLGAWALGALAFADTRSVASATRWLLPFGGATLGLLVGFRRRWLPAWHQIRTKLGGVPCQPWPSTSVQRLINLCLVVVVGAVLAITTIAISRYMLFGGESLGGPIWPSFFAKLRKDVSYGGPIGILVATLLFYSITEGRSWLAVAGSLVYQYVVLVAIVLLFVSPHPKLASEWFLNVMQAVSLGMSGYGLVWFHFRDQIQASPVRRESQVTQLDIHTAINCLLVLSLSALITQRFYLWPARQADWINEAGGVLGIAAVIAVVAAILVIWRSRLPTYRFALLAGVGWTAVAFAACFADRRLGQPLTLSAVRWPFRILAIGLTAASILLVSLLAYRRRTATPDLLRQNKTTFVPVLLMGLLANLFVIRGCSIDLDMPWEFFILMAFMTCCVIAYGLVTHSAWGALFAAITNFFLVSQLVKLNPLGLFSRPLAGFHSQWIGVMAVACCWMGYYRWSRTRFLPVMRRGFLRHANFVLIISALICLGLGIAPIRASLNWAGGLAVARAMVVTITMVGLWNDRAAWRVAAPCFVSVGVALALLHAIDVTDDTEGALSMAAVAGVIACWGYVFAKRSRFGRWGQQSGMLRLASLERLWQVKLPRFQAVAGGICTVLALGFLNFSDLRVSRYAAACVPFLVGIGMFPLAFQPRKHTHRYYLRRSQKQLPASRAWLLDSIPAIVMGWFTIGLVFLSWADLRLEHIRLDSMHTTCRATLALGAAVFLYGWWLPTRLSEDSDWRPVVRSTTVVTVVLAIVSFAWLLCSQALAFQVGGPGSGLAVSSAAAVSVVVVAMVLSLLAIAIYKQYDPLSLSMEQRQNYVYAAQLVTVMLGVHIYLAMPWLFEFGILRYWPYIAMLFAFGGVAIAEVLDRRELDVLARPIFNTGALIPIVTAVGFWTVASRADAALVMLLGGLLYLGIALTRKSLQSAVAAVLFGNFSLWLFYDKFPGLSFLAHPQLWLIPPAISVLAAGHWNRHRLSQHQLASLRYISLATIYLSSTSEIFIAGLGQQLLPPMILAILAVAGIFTGMLLEVRAFLYLGALFLLLAMVTMVAHAQQRLDHVWPWWAFGLILGTAILVMFGLFEKRRSDMRAIVSRLNEWDK